MFLLFGVSRVMAALFFVGFSQWDWFSASGKRVSWNIKLMKTQNMCKYLSMFVKKNKDNVNAIEMLNRSSYFNLETLTKKRCPNTCSDMWASSDEESKPIR